MGCLALSIKKDFNALGYIKYIAVEKSLNARSVCSVANANTETFREGLMVCTENMTSLISRKRTSNRLQRTLSGSLGQDENAMTLANFDMEADCDEVCDALG